MTGPATEASLLTATVLFCRALRERGLVVTPAEAVDAVRTLALIDVNDRREAFLSFRSVLTSRVEEFPVFEELFEIFWMRLEQRPKPGKVVEQATPSTVKKRVRRPSTAATRKDLAFFLDHWAGASPNDSKPINLPRASGTELIAKKDLSQLRSDELDEIARVARRIVKRLASRPSRRWQPVRRGTRVNLRRSLRHSLRTGGELIELSFKQRKQKKTRLVVLCDVSGSMDLYSRLFLQFVYGLQNSFARVESFIFSTSLQRITGDLRNRAYNQALESLSANVLGWSGGTLIGESIAAFNSDWPTLVDRRTIVVILSDGWDTGDPAELVASLSSLRRRAGRLIWLNPLLGSTAYQPLTRGMQAALPHIDVFAPLNSLASLRALEPHLVL